MTPQGFFDEITSQIRSILMTRTFNAHFEVKHVRRVLGSNWLGAGTASASGFISRVLDYLVSMGELSCQGGSPKKYSKRRNDA